MVSPDDIAICIQHLPLFVVAVEYKRPRLIARRQIARDISVFVVLEICACKPIGIRFYSGRRRDGRTIYALVRGSAVAVKVVAKLPNPRLVP